MGMDCLNLRRFVACAVFTALFVLAWFVPCQTDECAKTYAFSSNPQGQLSSSLPNNTCACANKDGTQDQKPHWYASSEWWLVIVAIPTLILIWWQARETARSAKASEDNIRLQIAALRQWVNIQGFRDGVEPRFTPTGTELDLQLSFEITNPTKMPLTVEWYVISINGTKYSSRLNVTLAPDQMHGLMALISYTDEVKNEYLRDGYVIIVTGVIAYTDALKEFQKQRFGYLRRCRPGHGETLNYKGPLPDEDIEKEESKKD